MKWNTIRAICRARFLLVAPYRGWQRQNPARVASRRLQCRSRPRVPHSHVPFHIGDHYAYLPLFVVFSRSVLSCTLCFPSVMFISSVAVSFFVFLVHYPNHSRLFSFIAESKVKGKSTFIPDSHGTWVDG